MAQVKLHLNTPSGFCGAFEDTGELISADGKAVVIEYPTGTRETYERQNVDQIETIG